MIRFEQAVTEDAKALTQVQIRAFAVDVEICGDGPPGYDSVERQAYLIENHLYYKVLDEDRIIGGFIIFDEGNGLYEIYRLFIDPDYQGKGVGTSTLSYIEKLFCHAKKLELETPDFSYKNHIFYEKAGYVKVGEVAYPGGGFSFKYEKVL